MESVGTAKPGSGDGVSRRDFLRVGGLSVLGLTVRDQSAQRAYAEANGKGLRRCIFLLLTGGPSALETFDPKPLAPADIRGPFKAVATSVPGVCLSETLPLLAQRTGKVALLRSLWHDATPIHETSQQLLQTGRLSRSGINFPSTGSMVARALGVRGNLPPYAVLPRPLSSSGVVMWQGQAAGHLGEAFDPWDLSRESPPASSGNGHSGNGEAAAAAVRNLQSAADLRTETDQIRRQYGETPFGKSCLQARRLVEQGVRFVTVNMFDSLADRVTWDCHASARWAPGNLFDYRDSICPDFDRAFSALIDDLELRGLLQETLVVAAGEFGRTPRINEFGGRDHWTGVWSAVLAGGGIEGGQVIGASDSRGSLPADSPVHAAQIAPSIMHSLGIDLGLTLATPDGTQYALADAPPIAAVTG